MKRTLIAMASVSLITALTGCASHKYCRPTSCSTCGCAPEAAACASCDGGSCQDAEDPGDGGGCCGHLCRLFRRKERMPREYVEAVNPGPASGAITYPYYTNRGPRDYLERNPQSIGPSAF